METTIVGYYKAPCLLSQLIEGQLFVLLLVCSMPFNSLVTISSIITTSTLNIIIDLLTINVMTTTYIIIRWFFAAIGI